MKRLRNGSGNATSKPYASVGETQSFAFLVSFPYSSFWFQPINTLIDPELFGYGERKVQLSR